MLLAQVDPATLITGTNLTVVAAIIGAVLLWRTKDKIGNALAGRGFVSSDGSTTDKTSGLADLKAKLKADMEEIKKGVADSEPVQAIASEVCRVLIDIADALPNTDKAIEIHAKLRDAFVEFGDPTPAVPAKV